MPNTVYDDPTIPPPGKRTGDGSESILPYLVKSLATKPQVQPHPEDAAFQDSEAEKPASEGAAGQSS